MIHQNNHHPHYDNETNPPIVTLTGALHYYRLITSFLMTYLFNQLGIKCLLMALILFLSCFSLLLNHVTTGYQPIFFAKKFINIGSLVLVFYFIVGLALQHRLPKLSAFLCNLTTIYFIIILMTVADTAIQLTPFPLYDDSLYHLDQKMGFDIRSLLAWVDLHPLLHSLSWDLYKSLPILLIASPPLMGFCKGQQKTIHVFFISILISTLIGYLIYYFFPTSGSPYAALQDSYFTRPQHYVFSQFLQIHHYQPVSHTFIGIIGFPSFHVIWAVLLSYLFKNYRYLFIVSVAYALLIMLSTLTTGWHYLTDVFGGILVGVVSIYLAEKAEKHSQAHAQGKARTTLMASRVAPTS